MRLRSLRLRALGGLLVAVAPSPATASEEASTVLFRDVASAVGLDFVHFNGMTGELYFPEIMGGGVALLDYDNDGDLDVYLGQGAMLGSDPRERLVFPPKLPLPVTDRLFRNDLSVGPDGERRLRFVDTTREAGLRATGYNMGVATGDYDNDGWIDLYVTNLGSNQLLHNDGDGSFTDTTRRSGADNQSWSVAASFFDYDRDGWLDLFVGNYTEFRPSLHKECNDASGTRDYCGPLSYTLLPNRLLRNRGDGTFENVTGRALPGNPAASTLGAVIGDLNGDLWPDIYVANDQVPNHLWLNRGDGTFVEDAELAGVAVDGKGQPQASMGVVVGDLDGDGDEDLFMSHLRSEMNTVYVNDGSGLFTDGSARSGLGSPSFPYTGFGVALFDYDNDGALDLYVANGAVKRIEAQLRAGDPYPLGERNLLFRGLGGGRFAEIPAERIEPARSEVSRGVARGDLDNDGDLDLVVTSNAGAVRLLENLVGAESNWLGLRLLLADTDRDALGARVELRLVDSSTQVRRVATDGSYTAANDPRVLFGLGPVAREIEEVPEIEQVAVAWPDGSSECFGADRVKAGAYSVLRQGAGKKCPADPQ